MMRLSILLSFCLAAPVLAQEFPATTPAGETSLDELVESCVRGGAVNRGADPKSAASTMTLTDAAKLKAVVEASRGSITPATVDALIARCGALKGEPAIPSIELLRCWGEVSGEGRVQAFADYFDGMRRPSTDEGLARLAAAGDRFARLGEPRWEAWCLFQRAVVMVNRGDYARGLELHTKALEIRRALLGEKHPEVATSYNGVGVAHLNRGDLPKARELQEKALAIRRETVGDRHLDTAQSYYNLGIIHRLQGQPAEALAMFEKSLEIRRALLGDRHLTVLAAYNGVAIMYLDQGEPAKALAIQLKILEIRRALLGERHADVGQTYNNLGLIHGDLGELSRSLEMHLKGLEIRREALGERHPDVAASYLNTALAYRDLGELEKSLELNFKALEIDRAVLGDRHIANGKVYNNLAIVYRDQGELAKSLEMFHRSLEIHREALGDRHPDVATLQSNIGLVHRDLGELDRALEFNLTALETRRAVLGEKHHSTADSYNNLGIIHGDQLEFTKALATHEQARAIRVAALGEKHPAVAQSDSNVATIYHEQGRLDLARATYTRALEINREALGDRHPEVAKAHLNLAQVLRDQGQAGPSFQEYDRALQALGFSPTSPPDPMIPTILLSRVRLRDAQPTPDLEAMLADCRAAAEVLDRLREVASNQDDKIRKGEEITELFPSAVGVLERMAAASGSPAPRLEAFAFAERGAARVFLENLGRSRASAAGRVAPAILLEETRLATALLEVDGRIAREQDKPFEKRDKDVVERLLADRKQAEVAWQALLARMERDSPQYAAMKRPRPCAIAEARACLDDDERALVYVLGDRSSYLLVIAPRDEHGTAGISIHPLPPAETIREAVVGLTREKTLGDADATRELGSSGYRMLLGPASAAIAGKRLVIVPGGVLGQLPFELLTEPDGRFLVEGHAIRYAPSLTALHFIRRWEAERPRPTRELWALGDPVYDATDPRAGGGGGAGSTASPVLLASRGGGFHRLPGSGEEVEKLATLLGSASGDRLVGLDATEPAVKRLSSDGTLARYRYLHFACHGVLGASRGERPGLVLAQVNDSANTDGYLRIDEVTDLRLNADLVVLSACQSGQGTVYRAEGVSGLARAFLYAGTRGVLCSLWPVEDEATADLMVEVYQGLKNGKPAAEALRAAQLAMIAENRPPNQWAPFVLIGR